MARQFYRPILDLGPAAKYWVRDFLQSWIMQGLQVSADLQGFALIWQDMVAYTETLPAWQSGGNELLEPCRIACDGAHGSERKRHRSPG